eukprot:g21032.t1
MANEENDGDADPIEDALELVEEVERARCLAADNDHESSGEEDDSQGFNAALALRKFAKGFETVPRGGQREQHLHQINKRRTTSGHSSNADIARPLDGAVDNSGDSDREPNQDGSVHSIDGGPSDTDRESDDDDDDDMDDSGGFGDTDRKHDEDDDAMDEGSDFSADASQP